MTNVASLHPLRAMLAELAWTPQRLARELNELAGLLDREERMHATTPYKWMRGARPRAPWPTLVVALVAEELGRLVTPSDLGWVDSEMQIFPASSGLTLPWTLAGSVRAARAITHPGSMDQRIFAVPLDVEASAPVHEWLLARPDTAEAARSAGPPLTMSTLDNFAHIAVLYSRLDDKLGGRAMLRLIHGNIHPVMSLLDQHSYPDVVGRRLHATGGELMRLAGRCAFDAGYHPLAQRYWIAALHAAHAAGDQALGANVVRSMSEQAEDLGQTRLSVTLAKSAKFGYPGGSPRLSALLDFREAEAHAAEQEDIECRRALDSAFSRLGDAPPSSGEPDWYYWLDEAQTHAYAGSCYLRLRDWSRARHHLDAALGLQNSGYPRESARRHIDLATTYLYQDRSDVDQALALAGRAVDILTKETNSVRCVTHLTRFLSRLTPYLRRPTVRQFTDHVTAQLTST